MRPLQGNPGLKKSRNQSVRHSTARLQRTARERADEQARRIPWQRLHEVRNQYIDWQEFNLWARSILEVEERIPDWLAQILKHRCQGFLEAQKSLNPQAAETRPLALRLEDWIDDHVFGFAKQECWFSAVTHYAIRNPRYQRAEVCWAECVKKWKKAKPIRYPSFEEWKGMAVQCDATDRLTARERKAWASAKLVDPDRLSEAVARYMDYEALAYWARHALELRSEPPAEVERELERRCLGYLDTRLKARARASSRGELAWGHLMLWIAVIGIGRTAHAGDHLVLMEQGDVLSRSIVYPTVGVMDQAGRWLSLSNRSFQGNHRQPTCDAPLQGPTHYSARKAVQNQRQVNKLASQANVGDIRHPKLIDSGQLHATGQVEIDLQRVI